MHPDETRDRRRINPRTIEIPTCRGDDTPNKQTYNNSRALHDRRAKALAQDDRDEDEEAEPDELRAAPGQGPGGVDVGAEGEETCLGPAFAVVRAAGPVREAGSDELDADEEDGGARDEGREDALEELGRGERHEDFEQGADALSAEDGAVALGAGQGVAVGVRRAVAVGVHLAKGAGGDGNGGEGGTDDGDQASA